MKNPTHILDGYVFKGPQNWRRSKDDSWETITVSKLPVRQVGSRHVDGTRVLVFSDGKKRYAATFARALPSKKQLGPFQRAVKVARRVLNAARRRAYKAAEVADGLNQKLAAAEEAHESALRVLRNKAAGGE